MTEPDAKEMKTALVIASIALSSVRALLAPILSGTSPTAEDVIRGVELCTTALAAIDNIDVRLHEEPD